MLTNYEIVTDLEPSYSLCRTRITTLIGTKDTSTHITKINLHTAFLRATTIAVGRPRIRNRAQTVLAQLFLECFIHKDVHSGTQGKFLDDARSLAGTTAAGHKGIVAGGHD